MRYLRTNVKRVRVGMLKREREREEKRERECVFYVLAKFYDIVNKHATMNHPKRNMEWMTFIKTTMNGETDFEPIMATRQTISPRGPQ